jgi:hypothetical protein
VAKANENTLFFHNFANHMKRINTIWEMKKVDSSREKKF